MKKHKPLILLLEDDSALAGLIMDELDTGHWQLERAGSLQEARACLQKQPVDLLISDLQLPDGNGMSLIQELAEMAEQERPAMIVITAFGSVREAVAALQAGADDFLTKPLDLDHFMISVRKVLQSRLLKDELYRYRQLSRNKGFHGLLGDSAPMRLLIEQIRVIGRAHGPVLISGESGTGKELVSRALHAESERAAGPFLAVNCAGIPPDLLESEFFGHAAGAFTGADKARKGLFQQAAGGSLLLDEIGEMPLSLQAKLLRALEDGSIRPVGRDQEEKVDVRVIAASHQNLKSRVEAGDFREDLYYRLETFTLRVPALRERDEDREILAQRFLQEFAVAQGKRITGFSDQALALLGRYHFPGNVRELRNAVERAVAFCDEDLISAGHLPERLKNAPATQGLTGQQRSEEQASLLAGPVLPSLEELQRRYARLVLQEVGGNKRRAAALLGIGRRTLYRWLQDDVA